MDFKIGEEPARRLRNHLENRRDIREQNSSRQEKELHEEENKSSAMSYQMLLTGEVR